MPFLLYRRISECIFFTNQNRKIYFGLKSFEILVSLKAVSTNIYVFLQLDSLVHEQASPATRPILLQLRSLKIRRTT